MKNPTPKQQEILDYMSEFVADHGYPPSVREICAAVGLRSPSTVHAHITALAEMGYIDREEGKNRAITINDSYSRIPVLGRVHAGDPSLAVEEYDGHVLFDLGGLSGDFFALVVRGDSMTGAGIFEDDTIIVRRQPVALSGEIVVALIDDETTVKKLMLTRGKAWLMPENPRYSAIDGSSCTILGKVCGLLRSY